jgi:hypothetical protein
MVCLPVPPLPHVKTGFDSLRLQLHSFRVKMHGSKATGPISILFMRGLFPKLSMAMVKLLKVAAVVTCGSESRPWMFLFWHRLSPFLLLELYFSDSLNGISRV